MVVTEYNNDITLFDTSETLNAIVARYPQALVVLKAFGLDTCCGGALPLSVAAAQHGLELPVLVAALRDEVAGEA